MASTGEKSDLLDLRTCSDVDRRSKSEPSARLMLGPLAPAKTQLGDWGYDTDWLCEALAERGFKPRIPSSKRCKVGISHDRTLWCQHHQTETVFGKIKAKRRIVNA